MNPQTRLAWHFLSDDGLTRYEPRQKVVVGEWLSVDPDRLELCEFGLHASERLIDALQYAPGSLLCRVELSGRVLVGGDKLCAQQRRVVAMANASNVLHEMACRSAESVYKNITDAKMLAAAKAAVDTKRLWMVGKATSEELSAARSAAWSPAESAAESAAWSAAESAAESAAWSAAESAAESAAWSAAESPAESAAWSAAESAAESAAWSPAESAAWSAAESAAESAAWSPAESAAWSAARSAQNDMLTQLAKELLQCV